MRWLTRRCTGPSRRMRLGVVALIALASIAPVGSDVAARIETGDLTVLDASAGSQQRYAAIARNPERNEYLVVNQRTRLGGIIETVVTRLASNGSILSGPTVIDQTNVRPATFARPDVAYNPATDQFLVVSVGIGAAHQNEIRGNLVSDLGQPVTSAVLHGSLGDSPLCQAQFPDVEADPATGGYKVLYTHFFGTASMTVTCGDLAPNTSRPVLASIGADLSVGANVDVPFVNNGSHEARLGANPVSGTFMVVGFRGVSNDGGFRIHSSDLAEVGSGAIARGAGSMGAFADYRTVADPTTGNWFVTSSSIGGVSVFSDLLSPTGASLRSQIASQADGRPHSLTANGDGTFLIGTTFGRLIQLAADGSQIFRADDLSRGSNRLPAVAADTSSPGAIAVGVDPLRNTYASLPLVTYAPGALPVVPARLLDTRTSPGSTTVDGTFQGGGPRSGGSVLKLIVAGRGGVPADASAALLNIAAAKAQANGFVTAYPCDANRPNTSNLNFATGAAASAAAISKLGADGTVCLFASTGIELIVDVNGFVPRNRTVESIVPARLMDTRVGADKTTTDGLFEGAGRVGVGSVTQLTVAGRGGVPGTADSALVNITAVRPSAQHFVTAFPCGADQPTAASLNAAAGSFVNNLVLAKIGDEGKVCLFSSSESDLIVDVTAYVPSGGGSLALTPARLLETRLGTPTIDGVDQGAGPIPSGPPRPIQVTGRGGVPEGATGAMVNAAAIRPASGGFMTIYPCDQQRPTAANLNFGAGAVVSNAVFVKLDPNGRLCIYTSVTSNATIDVVGYTVDT